MTDSPLVSAAQLRQWLQAPQADVLVCDCGFDLVDKFIGERNYRAQHIPGAIYVNLEKILSGPKTGNTGRHPLPDRGDFAAAMAAIGANNQTRIVAYDAMGGMYAARLWWMLRWAGHGAVCVLDGGLQAWQAEGLPVSDDVAPPLPAGDFSLRAPLVTMVDYEQVRANLDSAERLVIDARAPDRFRGENETIDAIGGHIPGAVNRLYRNNLDDSGRFKSAAQLKADFAPLLGDRDPATVISQCGSGVTACHNLLALEVAGLRGAALYPGSWSEWSSRPGSPITTGDH